MARMIERFGGILSRGLTERLDEALARNEVRPDVTAAELTEALAGITFLALLTRGSALSLGSSCSIFSAGWWWT